MNFLIATNKQIKTILENDGECPSPLLTLAFEEAIRRDLYESFFYSFLAARFQTVKNAEYALDTPFDELKLILYTVGYQALNHYKPGKNPFVSFWSRFMNTKIKDLARDQKAQKRAGETVTIDDEEHPIQLVDDRNIERKVINKITVQELLSGLSELERKIVLQRNMDYTFPEIAKDLGYSKMWIWKNYKLALQKMREIAG